MRACALFDTLMKIGWPEGRILAETTIYLATSPKVILAYSAINDALELVRLSWQSAWVSLHLRNVELQTDEATGYGRGI